MAITGEYFTCDGSNRIFTPSTNIISQNHVRVDYYLTDPEVTYSIDLDAWYLINNSIIFKEAPPAGRTLVITISNIGIDLGTPASEVSVVAHNMPLLRDIHNQLNNLTDIIKEKPIYSETAPSTVGLENGALWFQPSTKTTYILSGGTWVSLLSEIESGYIGASSEPPTSSSDGGDLKPGDKYFDTDTKKMMIWDGSAWVVDPDFYVIAPIDGMVKKVQYLGDGTKKSFTVTDGYTPNMGQVFLNGSNVTYGVDISDGANIVFEEAPKTDDEITAIFYGVFKVADCITNAEFDTSFVPLFDYTGSKILDKIKAANKDIETFDKNRSLILEDRGNGTKYRLYIENGNLGIEEV